jgi:DNA modification methylase
MENKNVDLFGEPIIENVLLRSKFMEPPFSILDSKGGDWQNRKRAWKDLGIKSEIGRDAECMPSQFGKELDENGLDKYGRKPMTGTSVFDPALCELMYHWFCPEGGGVLDPFAGGSVRGIVANYLGRKYTGIDIRQEQVDANRENALEILPVNNQPQWYVGDSNEVLDGFTTKFDFMLSCPPYLDLEVYSDLPNDLSTKGDAEFYKQYGEIIKKCFNLLKSGSYAVFVVGDVRDKQGNYRCFNDMTTMSFLNAGFKLYNKAILLQPLGTAMLRAGKIFNSGGKLTKVHEDILIFKKP